MIPTDLPSATAEAIVPAAPNSASSGCAPNTKRSNSVVVLVVIDIPSYTYKG